MWAPWMVGTCCCQSLRYKTGVFYALRLSMVPLEYNELLVAPLQVQFTHTDDIQFDCRVRSTEKRGRKKLFENEKRVEYKVAPLFSFAQLFSSTAVGDLRTYQQLGFAKEWTNDLFIRNLLLMAGNVGGFMGLDDGNGKWRMRCWLYGRLVYFVTAYSWRRNGNALNFNQPAAV